MDKLNCISEIPGWSKFEQYYQKKCLDIFILHMKDLKELMEMYEHQVRNCGTPSHIEDLKEKIISVYNEKGLSGIDFDPHDDMFSYRAIPARRAEFQEKIDKLLNDEKLELSRVATFSHDEKEASEAMKKLKQINKTYHWCFEYDQLVICDEDPEFKHCLCFK